MSRKDRSQELERWRKEVGERREESQWFYEQAEANEAARIILAEYVEELKAEIEKLRRKNS